MSHVLSIIDYSTSDRCHVVPENAISVSISQSGIPVAGSEFNLICTVSEVISGLTNMPTAAWLDSNNMVITQDIAVSRSDNVSSSILRFNPLRTSLQQRYTCSGSIVSPALTDPVGVTTDSTFIIESMFNSDCYC